MAVKGGQIIHAGNGTTVIDRVQTGGAGQVNIPTEKINELGNYKSVATVRDVPDLQFSLESFDVSTEVEALLTGGYEGREVSDGVATAAATAVSSATAAFTSADVGRQIIVVGAGASGADLVTTIASITSATAVEVTDAAGTTVAAARLIIAENGYDLALADPVDFASQFKAGANAASPFAVVGSIALPFLYLEQMSYRFGLRDNASQQAQLRGDTIFYNPGATYVQTAAGTGVAGQTIATTNPAYKVDAGDQRRVLAVTIGARRLTFGTDYTESYGAITAGAATTTVTITDAVAATDTIRIIYASPTTLSYPQNTHPSSTTKPAAVKGKDIEVYIGGYDPNDVAGSAANKVGSIQSINVDWRVTLEKDEEMGNAYAVGQDFEVPQVNGSMDFKPTDPAAFQALLRDLTGITDQYAIVSPGSTTAVALDVVIKHPDTGEVLKRLHVADARFTPPAVPGRVLQKLSVSLPWESDEGSLLIYRR